MRQRGLRTTLAWAAYGFLRCNRFCVFARDVSVGDPVPARTAGVTYTVWPAEAVAAWRRGREGLPPELFQDTIDGVSLCSVALVGGDVGGFIWIYRSGDASRLFELREGQAELNHGAVLAPYRKMGLFRGVLVSACAWLGAAGHRTVYANVHAANGPSLRAFRAAGFRDVATVWHVGPYRPKFRG